MGAGRPRKPTAVKVIEGTARKDRTNKREPVIKKEIGAPPAFLSPEQVETWNYYIENVPKGMLKVLDQATLANYVVAEDMWRQSVLAVRETGLVITTPNGVMMPSPHSTELKKYSLIMLRLATELGFTPSSRSKIVMDEEQKPDDPWEKLANES